MHSHLHRLIAAAALLAGLAGLQPARAAQGYDNCTGFIDSVPATIGIQGTWCLRGDLSTGITSGNAITIATNNVTIDCNDFKLGGMAAGNGSDAVGIYAEQRQNITVRRCNVRGFLYGIDLEGGAGHLVEDNRLDNNLFVGIGVYGDNDRVQRNRVYDTGGRTGSPFSYGISADADLVDNTVSGLFADTSGGFLTGIRARGAGAQVRGNRVSGFDMTATDGGGVDNAYGIALVHPYQRVSGNQVSGGGGSPVNGVGIAPNNSTIFCMDNSVGGFTTNIDGGCIDSGNLTAP